MARFAPAVAASLALLTIAGAPVRAADGAPGLAAMLSYPFDSGLIAALKEDIAGMKEMKLAVRSHADSAYAGALGAALWGAYRFDKLVARGEINRAA